MLSHPRRLLLSEGNAVRDHRNKLRIRRLALDIRHRVAEEALQGLNIAPIPCDLNRVADFRDFRPEIGDAQRRFCEAAQPLD